MINKKSRVRFSFKIGDYSYVLPGCTTGRFKKNKHDIEIPQILISLTRTDTNCRNVEMSSSKTLHVPVSNLVLQNVQQNWVPSTSNLVQYIVRRRTRRAGTRRLTGICRARLYIYLAFNDGEMIIISLLNTRRG